MKSIIEVGRSTTIEEIRDTLDALAAQRGQRVDIRLGPARPDPLTGHRTVVGPTEARSALFALLAEVLDEVMARPVTVYLATSEHPPPPPPAPAPWGDGR